MDQTGYDVIIIGGGIVGLATAMALTQQTDASVLVLEKENRLAAHQTGNNSGVIHSGIYYKPGSLKARNCVEGRRALIQFAEQQGIPYELCGKVIVATREEELPALETLEQRAAANGLSGARRLSKAEIKEIEPHTDGLAGLHVPETGIIDYKQVVDKYAEVISANGGQIRPNARMIDFERASAELVVKTSAGDFKSRYLVNCAGLQSDRIARMCGLKPDVQIIPFRGEYYDIIPEKHYLVKNLIYPVPDPRFPFLGVHFTRRITGGIEAGPNAVLAFKREGYKFFQASLPDLLAYAGYGGFWRMATRYWKMAVDEYYRSLSKAAFVRALQKLVPELGYEDVHRGGAGVRAQALAPDGALVDDFKIAEAEGMIHVLNAPSPAATASISIGRTIASMALSRFNLPEKQRI